MDNDLMAPMTRATLMDSVLGPYVAQYCVKSLPKVTPFSRANPTPLEVSDRLFEVEDRRAVGLRGVIAEVLGSRSFSPCRTPVVAR